MDNEHIFFHAGRKWPEPYIPDDDKEAALFETDLIHVGEFKHTKFGNSLVVTRKKIDQWVDTFNRMQANGDQTHVVRDHSFAEKDKIGEIVEMHRDGDTLMATHRILGQANIDHVAKMEPRTSFWVENLIGNDGQTDYGEAILHNSIVGRPAMTKQLKFLPVAASNGGRGSDAVPVFVLAAEFPNQGVSIVDLTKLKALIESDVDLSEENALDLVEKHLSNIKGDRADLNKQLADATAKVKTLEEEIDTGKSPVADPDTLEMAADAATDKLDALVEAGKLNPVAAKALSSALIGPEGKRNAYALSSKVSGTARPLCRQVLDALKDNKLVPLKQLTGRQDAVALTSDMDDEDPAVKQKRIAADIERRAARFGPVQTKGGKG